MKTLALALFLLTASMARGQYYYNDIIGSKAMGDRMKAYVASKVKSINAVGLDKQGAKSSDFNEWTEVTPGSNTFRISTRTGQTITRQYYQFDAQYRLITLTDSSGAIKSKTTYTYNSDGNITSIKTATLDSDSLSEFSETEDHQWIYNAAGKPVKMWRIVNGKDSSEYRLTVDEKGNTADEQLYRRNVGIDPIYYYYNDAGQLTDIVRYNKKTKRLLPDIMFEYDESNRVIQRITITSAQNRDYLIWRYIFDDKGLKTKEALFDKDKELTGRIEYQYTFY